MLPRVLQKRRNVTRGQRRVYITPRLWGMTQKKKGGDHTAPLCARGDTGYEPWLATSEIDNDYGAVAT